MASRTAAHAGHLAEAAVADAVERLSQATKDGRPCPPVRDLIGSTDISAAYAVQDVLNRLIT